MSLREKYEHIMFYYKNYIIVGLLILVVGGYLLYTTITSVEPVLSVLMINNIYQEDATDQSVFDEFCSEYGYDNSAGKMTVTDNFYILTEEEGAKGDLIESSHQNLTALQTWLFAGADDVIIGSGIFMKNGLIDGEAFLDLREVFTPQQMEEYADYIIYGQPVKLDEEFEDVPVEELEKPYPCALLLKDNRWISENGYFKECYAAIPMSAGSKDAARDFLLYLLSKQP